MSSGHNHDIHRNMYEGARQWYLAIFSCFFTFVEEVSTGPMTPGFPTQTFFLLDMSGHMT